MLLQHCTSVITPSVTLICTLQGRSDGGYIGIYTPQISTSKLLWAKNDVRTAIRQFYTPKKLLYPQTNFWLRPWYNCDDNDKIIG